MNLAETIHSSVEEFLKKLNIEFNEVEITEEENNSYFINIKTDSPSLLIGYHGDNIHALQHIIKVVCWKKYPNEQFNILLDVDSYRKRQEENVISLAERKIEAVRKFKRPQSLPPMSAYFRRKVHTLCMGAGYEDVETISEGDNDRRHIIIKLKY